MTHFFDQRDGWGNRFSLWFIMAMAFVAPLSLWSLRQIQIDNDINEWISKKDPEFISQQWTLQQFPAAEQILVTWEGSSINDPRVGKLVEQLAGKADERGIKRGGVPYVASVTEPVQALDRMQQNGIGPQEAVRRLQGTILGAGPMRLRLTEASRAALRKTKREIQTAIHRQYGFEPSILDASPDLAPLISIVPPPGEGGTRGEPIAPVVLSVDGKIADNQTTEHDLQLSWNGMHIGSESTIAVCKWLTEYVPERGDGKPLVESGFFAPGSPVALVIGISDAGLADKKETIATLRNACLQAGISAESLHLTGNIVSSAELNDQLLKAAWNTSFPLTQFHKRSVILTSLLATILLAFVLLRNFKLATMVAGISSLATCCAVAIIPLTGDSIGLMLVVMPTLVMVLAMSAALHVVNYWKHADSGDESQAIVETARKSWLPCFLASLVAAISFIALGTSKLIPVRDLGLYAAAGTLLSFLIVAYGIPSLMQLLSVKHSKTLEAEQGGWHLFGSLLTTHPGLQSFAILAIGIGCSFGLSKFQTETNTVSGNRNDSQIAKDKRYIETNLVGTTSVDTIIRFDEESQKETNFLDRMEIVRLIQEQIRNHAEISGAASLVDVHPVSERLAEDAGFVQKSKYNKRALAVQQRVRDGEIATAGSFYTVSNQAHDLDTTGDSKLNKAGDELWRIAAHVNSTTNSDSSKILTDLHRITQDVLKLHPGSHHLITGDVPVDAQIQKAAMETLKGSLGLAFGLILGVFLISLRSIGASLVAMIPVVAPITVVLGLASWTGQRIDIGGIIAASVALGMTAGGTLHYLTLVQMAMTTGKTRREAVLDGLVRGGPAMFQASAIIIVGLLALIPAEMSIVVRFGQIMASMMGVALLSNIVLMPQLVAGPFGGLFHVAKSTKEQPALTMEPPAAVVEQPPAVAPEETQVPAPHLDPVGKKRRPSTRRGMDAG